MEVENSRLKEGSDKEYETYKVLDDYNINFVGNTLDFKVVLKLGNFKIDDGI